MTRLVNRYTLAVLFLAAVVGGLFVMSRSQLASARAADDKPAAVSGPHYTVLETDGTNLLVTDNATSTLYFYTVDKGSPIGSPVKLRAKVDLKDVGKPEIKPIPINIQK